MNLSHEKVRLAKAEDGLYAGTTSEIRDALRALQSTDTPGTEELSQKLFRRLKAFETREQVQALGPEWGSLEVRRETGGLRHYLYGKPIHCGTSLRLQHRVSHFDDYGEFIVGISGGTIVRYEAVLLGGEIRWTLHADVGGTEFRCDGEPWFRFKWPQEKR